MRLRKSRAIAAAEFDRAGDGLFVAVGGACGREWSRNAALQSFKVRPSRAISGIGLNGKLAMIVVASCHPELRSEWW